MLTGVLTFAIASKRLLMCFGNARNLGAFGAAIALSESSRTAVSPAKLSKRTIFVSQY